MPQQGTILNDLPMLVLASVVVLGIVSALFQVPKMAKLHRGVKDLKLFYKATSDMWGLASQISGTKTKDETIRLAKAEIKRFQVCNTKLRNYSDPRMFQMAFELYKLLSQYVQVSGDSSVEKRFDKQVMMLKSSGLW